MESEKINKLQVTFLVMMLFGYELISFFPGLLNMESSRPMSVAYRICVLLLALFVIFKNQLTLKKEHCIIYFFWFLYLIRLVYDTAITSRTIHSPLGDYWAFSVGILVSSMACTSNFSQQTILSVRKWVIIILAVVNVWGLYNNVTQPQIYPDDVLIRTDANASLNTVSFGRTSAVLFFICFTIFLEKNKMLFKVLLGAGMALALFNLFMAGSRGPLVQLIVIIIVFLLSARKNINKKYILLFIGAAILFVTMFPEYLDVSKLLFERFKETGFSSNDSDRLRAEYFNSAWNQFADHPFFGDSIETIVGGTYPHNLVLESLMALGILGGILVIIIIILAIVNSISYLKIPYYNWIGAILLMDVIASFSSGSIANYLLFWPLLSLTINRVKNAK